MKTSVILVGGVCLSIALLSACSPQPEQKAEPAAGESSSGEEDLAAIKPVVTDKWAAAMEAEDIDALMSLYSDDAMSHAILMNPHMLDIKRFERSSSEDLGKNAFEIVKAQSMTLWYRATMQLVRGSDNDILTPKGGGETSNLNSKWSDFDLRSGNQTAPGSILWGDLEQERTVAPGDLKRPSKGTL